MASRRLKLTRQVLLTMAALAYGSLTLNAQEPAAPVNATPNAAVVAASPTAASKAAETNAPRQAEQYRIGPRDVLSIRVTAGHPVPELSLDSVEVSECGTIPLPSVQQETQNEIRAAGLTRNELAEQLRQFYMKYKRNPQVVVTIREYNSQPVAINGAVAKPGPFQMRRAVRLQELVQFYAGGPTDRAGGTIQLARLDSFDPCLAQPASANADSDGVSFQVFKLSDTLAGVEQANPYLQPGDVITLPEAKEAYVVGNVLRPMPIPLKDDKVTVTQAIAMAGGVLESTKKDKVHIIRQGANGAKQDIIVDLRAINKQQSPDVALMPNDIVEVPVSGSKKLIKSLIGIVPSTASQLPVRVIP
jgi:polysaccharide biosynthesis/export protein